MRFADTSSFDPKNTLATWFLQSVVGGIEALFVQTGYFTGASVDFLNFILPAPALEHCKLRILLGSNGMCTTASDVEYLVTSVGLPNVSAKIGIICFAEGLYHPKLYLIKRKNGSQTAYVGSGNFTPNGLSKNIETAIILDTLEGDPVEVFNEIIKSTERWFTASPAGFHRVENAIDVADLKNRGILAIAPPPAQANPKKPDGKEVIGLPKLKPIVTWPKSAKPAIQEAHLVYDSIANIAVPKQKGPVTGQVIVAEITKGRPGKNARQIDFGKDIAEDYFGGVGTKLEFYPVLENGTLGLPESRTVGTKPSANYYVELAGLQGTITGEYNERPLLLIDQPNKLVKNYHYFWLHPTHKQFHTVYAGFITPQLGNRKGKNSIKITSTKAQLKAIWPTNPFTLLEAKEKK